MQNITEKNQRRVAHNRRKNPANLLCKYTVIGGRRRSARRKEDRKKYVVLDSYSSRLWIVLLSVLFLCVVDAYLTMLLLDTGIAEEANPIMAFYLGYGPQPFIIMKLLLTATPLFFFCLFKDFTITKISLASSIIIYFSIVLYELAIIYKFQSHLYF